MPNESLITSTKVERRGADYDPYPCFQQVKDVNEEGIIIILFTDEDGGFVVHTENIEWNIGEPFDKNRYSAYELTPFYGDVTISCD